MPPALAAERPYKFHSDFELSNALKALSDSLKLRAQKEPRMERARIFWADRDLCREAAMRLRERQK